MINKIPNIRVLDIEKVHDFIRDPSSLLKRKRLIIVRLSSPRIGKDKYIDIEIYDTSKHNDPVMSSYYFNGLKDSKNFGSYQDAYTKAYAWWNLYEHPIVKKINNEIHIRALKTKTKEHFGDILRSIDESAKSVKNERWVLMLVGKIKKSGTKYKLKLIEDLNLQEKEKLKSLKPSHIFTDWWRVKQFSNSHDCLAFYGLKHKVLNILEYYKEQGYNMIKIMELKPGTHEHFGDIVSFIDESVKPERWVLMILGKIKKSGTAYKLKKTKDLSLKEKEKLKNLKRFYGFAKSWHVKVYANSDDCIAFYGLEQRVLKILEYYKGQGYKMMEKNLNLKPSTREHFGDIMSSIDESVNKKFVLIIKADYDAMGSGKHTYKIIPIDEMSVKEQKEFNKSEAYMRNKSGTVTKRNDYPSSSICFIMGDDTKVLKSSLKKIVNFGAPEYTYEPEMELKPETKKHFGDIMQHIEHADFYRVANGIINENKQDKWVVIEKSFYDKEGNLKKCRYQLKLVSQLTDIEKDALNNHTTKLHSYMKGYVGNDILGAGEVLFVFDKKEALEKHVRDLKSFVANTEEEIPLKDATRKHFGDIVDNV